MTKGLVSVIIPARNERYLHKTIQDLLTKAKGDIEIIAVLDGYWPKREEIIEEKRVHYIHFSNPRGMRNAINSGVRLSKGEFILKTDAHCMFAEGYDTALKTDCEEKWVVVPRRYRLDPEKWELTETDKPPVDYMYLAYPKHKSVWGGEGLQGKEWREKNLITDTLPQIDDLMTAQGSCWFMRREFYDYLELMDEENYGSFAKEMQEIGLKAWLGPIGGKMVVNKKTWYAHWHKTKENGRGYSLNDAEFQKGSTETLKWLGKYGDLKAWHKQTMLFAWFLRHFKPVPTWPEEEYDSRITADNR
jgi:glycosyltransferase involved in cell wall biosynthesis